MSGQRDEGRGREAGRAPDAPDVRDDGRIPGDDAPPGPFRSWGALYALVIGWAAFLVVALWAAGRLLTP